MQRPLSSAALRELAALKIKLEYAVEAEIAAFDEWFLCSGDWDNVLWWRAEVRRIESLINAKDK